ncbi:MAG: CPBP family intramembrane metalloprotease [Candidatus Riflebacteria bacterium]|nr:CPBP family intramembrane metalloprotease [Candidatus Riflebacteria bacterium]
MIESNKSPFESRFAIGQIAVASTSAIILVWSLLSPAVRTPYLLGSPIFAVAALLLTSLFFGTTFIRQYGIAHAVGVVSFAALGYAVMELFYDHISIAFDFRNIAPPVLQPFFTQINEYILDRSYQYVAVAVLFGGLSFALGRDFIHALRIGNLDTETTILGKEAPMPWKRALMRIAALIAGVTIVSLVICPTLQISDRHLALYVALLLGGLNNSLIEELVFRGLLQPAFSLRLQPETAIIVQAVLFSVVHYSYIGDGTWAPIIQEVSRLFIYAGIGLVFGQATRETSGIGVSTSLHFLITSAIWARLTFTNPV